MSDNTGSAPLQPEGEQPKPKALTPEQIARKLRNETLGCRISRSRFGTSKALTAEQRERAAAPFHADHGFLGGRKKLINTRAKEYLAVQSLLLAAAKDWQDMTVPYPEPGTRLIRRDRVDEFIATMKARQAELEEAKKALQAVYPKLREEAVTKLGELHNAADYPTDIAGLFSLEFDFPNVEPPAYLKQLNPEAYQSQLLKVQAQFEVAVAKAEAEFAGEFKKIVERILDRLTPDAEGKPKIFKSSTFENLNDFFAKFKLLKFGSNPELEKLIAEAEQAAAGKSADDIRKDTLLQQSLKEKFGELSKKMADTVVEAGTREFDFDDEEPASGDQNEAAA